jgi:GMP synthase-like glutamine amidotransferase
MFRTAILDLYNGSPNLGMTYLRNLVKAFPELTCKVFDVRAGKMIPDTSFDLYIFSGGPGDPRDIDPKWGVPLFYLIDSLWEMNQDNAFPKKHAFFICHSFQTLCWHWGIGKLSKRHTRAFGIYPVHKTAEGLVEPLFSGLPDPFYVGDFRDYQVTDIDQSALDLYGAKVTALEKVRPHVDLKRAAMAIRFSDTWFGTQFHPEASPLGMLEHFTKPDKRDEILEFKHPDKYTSMITELYDPNKLGLTQCTILPRFLRQSIENLQQVDALC